MSDSRSVLLLTPQLPWPLHQGTTLRNFQIVQGLAQRHKLTLLTFVEDDSADFGPLPDLCEEIVTIPAPLRSGRDRLFQLLTTRTPDLAGRLESLSFDLALDQLLTENRFDIVQIEGLELASRIDIVRLASPQSRIIYDAHNAETALQASALRTDRGNPRRWPAALYSAVQIGRLRRFERQAVQSADAVAAVSDEDAATLHALGAPVLPAVIPNCLDVEGYSAPTDGAGVPAVDCVFVGKLDYRPNIDAVLWFADAIWPLVRAARPHATVAIVGQKPHPRLDRLRTLPGFTLTGRVPDVRPWLAGAGVVVIPLRMGSGTRLKLIEALAARRPVVSTTIGAAGFPVLDGVQLRLADQSADFAAAILHLLDHPAAAAALAAAGHAFARQYDWRSVIPRFETLWKRQGV
jgi:glycosyltransferase involved in cell wall biosynthesis